MFAVMKVFALHALYLHSIIWHYFEEEKRIFLKIESWLSEAKLLVSVPCQKQVEIGASGQYFACDYRNFILFESYI